MLGLHYGVQTVGAGKFYKDLKYRSEKNGTNNLYHSYQATYDFIKAHTAI